MSVGFIMGYDCYMRDTVLKPLGNRNYHYCIEKGGKTEPRKVSQLVREMLTFKPSSV